MRSKLYLASLLLMGATALPAAGQGKVDINQASIIATNVAVVEVGASQVVIDFTGAGARLQVAQVWGKDGALKEVLGFGVPDLRLRASGRMQLRGDGLRLSTGDRVNALIFVNDATFTALKEDGRLEGGGFVCFGEDAADLAGAEGPRRECRGALVGGFGTFPFIFPLGQ